MINTNTNTANTAEQASPYKLFGASAFPLILDDETKGRGEGKLISLPTNFSIEGWKDEFDPDIPVAHPEYVFRKSLFRDICAFLRNPRNHGLWLAGATGSGKTSVITELCARLNWPVHSVTCTGRLEFADLTGSQILTTKAGSSTPEVTFQYGALAKAMKYGHVLILNEVDLVSPDQLSGLNDILEGRPLVLTSNGGEVIRPHKKFRLVATANSSGSGDDTGAYAGVQNQNIAALDRYRFLRVDYMSPKQEVAVLTKITDGKIPPEIIKGMVRVANAVRKQFEEGELSSTMSCRTLAFWCGLVRDYAGCPTKLSTTLDMCFTAKLSNVERQAVFSLCAHEFGGDSKEWLGTDDKEAAKDDND
jgi:cobaltochelatase CobS